MKYHPFNCLYISLSLSILLLLEQKVKFQMFTPTIKQSLIQNSRFYAKYITINHTAQL